MLEIGKVYEVIGNDSHNFKDGEKVEVVEKLFGSLYLAKSLDPESEAVSLLGEGTQAIDADDVKEVI